MVIFFNDMLSLCSNLTKPVMLVNVIRFFA